MESDIPLLEVSAEDDSLIQDNEDGADINHYLTCSPFQVFGPNALVKTYRVPPISKENVMLEKKNPSWSSSKNHNNKENLGSNLIDDSQLRVNPHITKKRKTDIACSLHQSFAWDSAFLTDEGVLNSSELSILRGTVKTSERDNFPTTEEEKSSHLSKKSECIDCVMKAEIHDEISKKFFPCTQSDSQERPSSSRIRESDGPLVRRKSFSSCFPASKKMLSDAAIRRSISMRNSSGPAVQGSGSMRNNCPRVPNPSFQKRPANEKVTKISPREMQCSGTMGGKANAWPLPATARRSILAAGSNIQLSAPRESLSRPKTVKNNLTSLSEGETSKISAISSTSSDRENAPSASTKVHSLLKLQLQPLPHSSGASDIIMVPVSSTPKKSSDSSFKGGSLPNLSVQESSQDNQQLQLQRPSALRMPSPSMGFFHQSKNSSCRSQQNHAERHNVFPTKISDGDETIKVLKARTGSSVQPTILSPSYEEVKVMADVKDLSEKEGMKDSHGQPSGVLSPDDGVSNGGTSCSIEVGKVKGPIGNELESEKFPFQDGTSKKPLNVTISDSSLHSSRRPSTGFNDLVDPEKAGDNSITSPSGFLGCQHDNSTCIEAVHRETTVEKTEMENKADLGNYLPFSEEWLDAIEAAGEDILAHKTGAVQNSPPEKSLPEPGPWSPVKRKGKPSIGPFDCTKFTSALQPQGPQ